MAEEMNGQESGNALDLSALGSFDFAPSWATGEKVVARAPREERAPRGRDGRDDRSERDDFGGGHRGRREGFGERREGGFERRERRGDGGARREDFGGERREGFGGERREGFGGERRGGFGGERRGGFGGERRGGFGGERRGPGGRGGFGERRPFVKALEAEVRALPAQKELGGIIRKIQSTGMAYPLKQVAHLFLDNPSACVLRVTPKDPEFRFHVCKACGFVSFTEEALERHIFDEHMKDYFATEEKSDVPGGPVTHVVYRMKGAEGMAGMSRVAAEDEFRKTFLPQLKSESRTADLTAEQALKTQELPLLFACRDALRRERQFPGSLFFALRGAFHHRKLSFFRANDPRGPEFVTAAKPAPLDCEHAIPELVEIVKFVEQHPCCFRSQLTAEQQKHIGWLSEKGHLVVYFNGELAVPEANPKYKFVQPKKAEAEAKAEVEAKVEAKVEVEAEVGEVVSEVPVAEVPVAEAPVAEAPVAEATVEENVKKEEVKDEAAAQLAE